eukprot:GHVU01163417.1.p1 GENE.GHVU01163417.1~~GHVU01163417.1.p1  ORF type:complete len:108 (-),score=19.79 GHVU01163417.1:77-400(-)
MLARASGKAPLTATRGEKGPRKSAGGEAAARLRPASSSASTDSAAAAAAAVPTPPDVPSIELTVAFAQVDLSNFHTYEAPMPTDSFEMTAAPLTSRGSSNRKNRGNT